MYMIFFYSFIIDVIEVERSQGIDNEDEDYELSFDIILRYYIVVIFCYDFNIIVQILELLCYNEIIILLLVSILLKYVI